MRVSATTLESFRLFCEPEQDWMSEAVLERTIRGETEVTSAMRVGRAFGSVLEQSLRWQQPNGDYRCGGHVFSGESIGEALALIEPKGVFEAKGLKRFGEHEVVAKADHLYGAVLSEFKTTFGICRPQDYLDSYQWRYMTDIFEPAQIIYRVFQLRQQDDGRIGVRDISNFSVYPYSNLHADCCALLARFADYVATKGLMSVLDQHQATRGGLERDSFCSETA